MQKIKTIVCDTRSGDKGTTVDDKVNKAIKEIEVKGGKILSTDFLHTEQRSEVYIMIRYESK